LYNLSKVNNQENKKISTPSLPLNECLRLAGLGQVGPDGPYAILSNGAFFKK